MSDTAVASQGTYIGIEDPTSPGTFIDVSTKAHNVRMPLSKTDIDTSTFGQGDMTNKSGMRDGQFSFDLYPDAAVNELMWNWYMSTVPLRCRYGTEGSATGKERYTAYHNMTGYEPGGSVNTVNGAPASFHRTGPTTRDVF